MRRSQQYSVDERDLQLIKYLEEDGRRPWSEIAGLMNVSEATVYLRVKRLLDNGVLNGFTARIDPRMLGLTSTAFLLVRARADAIKGVRESLSRLPFVAEAYETTGPYNFLLKVLAPSQDDLSRAVEEVASIPGVLEISSIMTLSELRRASSLSSIYEYWLKAGGREA